MSAPEIIVELGVPPSANAYWRTTKEGHTYVSEEAKKYKAEVKRRFDSLGIQPRSGPVTLAFIWRRSAHRGDLSNRIKVLEDALQGCAFHDDKQVDELHAWRREGARDCVEVRIIWKDPPLVEQPVKPRQTIRKSPREYVVAGVCAANKACPAGCATVARHIAHVARPASYPRKP